MLTATVLGCEQMKLTLLWPFALLAQPAFACKCEMTLPVCKEVAYSNAVFIGTVESVTPTFLSRWNLEQGPSLKQLNEASERFLTERSPSNLTALKDTLRKTFP